MPPVFFRERFAKLYLSLFRGLCDYKSKPVGDTMHMGIHSYGILAKTIYQNAIRCLSSDSRKQKERIHIIRDFAFQVVADDPGDLLHPRRFDAIEPDLADQFLDVLHIRPGKIWRRAIF